MRAEVDERFGNPVPDSLPTILRSFKSASTKQINELCKSPGERFWQRGYFEHVIRNEREFATIAQYIFDNPKKWSQDKENPERRSL